MFFSLLLVVVAVIVGIPVFTGKGRLMATENIKKDKIDTYKKWLRIFYAVLMVVALLMAFFNFAEKVAYVQTHYYEFTEDYLGADEQIHPAGESHPTEEMLEILLPTETSGSMCAPADSSDPLPYKYTGTTYTLDEQYAFMSFIPYQTARIINFIGLGLSMVLILVLFIFINRMTDKAAQRKNAQAKNSPVRPSMPKGAFDFSDYKDEVEVAAEFSDESPAAPPAAKKKK